MKNISQIKLTHILIHIYFNETSGENNMVPHNHNHSLILSNNFILTYSLLFEETKIKTINVYNP